MNRKPPMTGFVIAVALGSVIWAVALGFVLL
jgi:hypothetical protein